MVASTRRYPRPAQRPSEAAKRGVQHAPPASVENIDEIPDDVRAELDREALQTKARGLPVKSPEFVPEDVLAEQDAADRAFIDTGFDDSR